MELRSNEVSPYIANAEGSEIPQDLSHPPPLANRRWEPRGLVPIEDSSKKDWLSMDGREAWQSVPKEASLGRRRICRDVCENTGSSFILTLFKLSPSSSLSDPGGIKQTGMITQNPLSAFCSAPWPVLAKSSSFNIATERKMVNLCCSATDLTAFVADKCHSSHAKRGSLY